MPPPEVRRIHLLDSKMPHLSSFATPPPVCSFGFDNHDWAQLTFDDMVVAVRCQTCAREPLDIMSEWRLVNDF